MPNYSKVLCYILKRFKAKVTFFSPDMCSRSVASPEDLLINQRDQQKSWYKGPRFLWNNTETEENESKIIEELPDINEEI